MEPDDELCLCFHVTRRKVINFLRVERPQRESQMSECYGAGTGCGWCRPYLQLLFEAAQENSVREAGLPSPDACATNRRDYIREGKGTPPRGATP